MLVYNDKQFIFLIAEGKSYQCTFEDRETILLAWYHFHLCQYCIKYKGEKRVSMSCRLQRGTVNFSFEINIVVITFTLPIFFKFFYIYIFLYIYLYL